MAPQGPRHGGAELLVCRANQDVWVEAMSTQELTP